MVVAGRGRLVRDGQAATPATVTRIAREAVAGSRVTPEEEKIGGGERRN